jgi:hypothetical protein
MEVNMTKIFPVSSDCTLDEIINLNKVLAETPPTIVGNSWKIIDIEYKNDMTLYILSDED